MIREANMTHLVEQNPSRVLVVEATAHPNEAMLVGAFSITRTSADRRTHDPALREAIAKVFMVKLAKQRIQVHEAFTTLISYT